MLIGFFSKPYVKFKDFFDNMDSYIKDYETNKGTPEEIAKQLAMEFR